MSLQDRLRALRGDRGERLLEPGERVVVSHPLSDPSGLRQLADDLGLGYHDESLRRDAAESAWREGHNR